MSRVGEGVNDRSIVVDKRLLGDERLSGSILFVTVEHVRRFFPTIQINVGCNPQGCSFISSSIRQVIRVL